MPILMTKEELARITRWTDTNREDPEVVRRRELTRYMDETSKEMTKTWPNSLENVSRRNEELRLARIQAAEQANATFYNRYVKRRKEQQQRLMHSARDTIFKNKDAPKLLLSAVIETCIQKERMEQVKFQNERRREAAARKRKDDDDIIRKAKEWEELMKNRRQLRFEVNKKHQKDILNQAHERAERNRTEYEMELKMQQLDNMKANQQIEAIKEFEDNFKAAEKARIWNDMDQAKREAVARREEHQARERMDDKLIEVLSNSKARVEMKRLQTEKNLKAEKLRVLESISAKLESGEAARAAREQAALDKAIAEKELLAEARRQKQLQRQTDARRDRLEQRERWLRDEAARLHQYNTKLQWECMNRFKNIEIYDDFKEKLREEKARKIKEYREDMLRLWKERTEREARERAETRYFYGELAEKKLRDADNKLLTHAAALLDEARAHGRPDHALHKAIDRYCKMYRLYPMPDLPKSVQEHFQRYAPWDGSRPDPGYSEPPAPPPERSADASQQDVAEAGGPRSGLQDPGKPSTSNTTNIVKKEETVDDYKRAGKANGLQRRNAQTDVTLPPITVIPCKNETCSCDLKK